MFFFSFTSACFRCRIHAIFGEFALITLCWFASSRCGIWTAAMLSSTHVVHRRVAGQMWCNNLQVFWTAAITFIVVVESRQFVDFHFSAVRTENQFDEISNLALGGRQGKNGRIANRFQNATELRSWRCSHTTLELAAIHKPINHGFSFGCCVRLCHIDNNAHTQQQTAADSTQHPAPTVSLSTLLFFRFYHFIVVRKPKASRGNGERVLCCMVCRTESERWNGNRK